jgi:hypothetical protein
MRALWPSLVLDRALVGSAFAAEAVVQELAFVLGPPLVALIVALTSARVAALSTAVVGLAGALAFVVASGERPGSGTALRSLGSAARCWAVCCGADLRTPEASRGGTAGRSDCSRSPLLPCC